MSRFSQIPVFQLFGETGDFPDVVHCERIRDRALRHDWRIDPHRHGDMVQILHMERGEALVQVDDEEIPLKDDEFIYIPAQAVHGFAFRQGAEGGVYSFPLTLIPELAPAAEGLSLQLGRKLRAKADPMLVSLLRNLTDAFASDGNFRASLLAALGRAILIAVAGAGARVAAEDEPLAQRRMSDFNRLLRQDLNAARTVTDYAQAMGITAGHLNRICRAATGTSASLCVEKARMTEAGRLLAFTRLSIAEIGYRLGYDDPSYFSRRFRQVTGETPSAYRARFLG